MTDSFVDKAEQSMGAIERLLKGLPLVREYNDKELRREADRRLRQLLVTELEQEKQRLYDVQKKLLRAGGLAWIDDADGAIQRLQTLIDRIKTASYGYAGLFAAVKIQEAQLDALHRFDVAHGGARPRDQREDQPVGGRDGRAGRNRPRHRGRQRHGYRTPATL